MKKLFSFLLLLISFQIASGQKIYPDSLPLIVKNPIAAIEGFATEDLTTVMVPIPAKERVYNKSGIQCVWASLECLGKYAEEPKFADLTKSPDCQGYASPRSTAKKLNQLGIIYEQTTSKLDRSLIIKSVVKERRGCLFSVPGHAMTLVHYDEKKGIVKYINNSDPSLAIRTWTMEEFNQQWDGWICVIYADNDIIPQKYIKTEIKIIDRNNPQGSYTKDYILFPK